MPPQHGKFLKEDILCLTTKGWKKHSDLQFGDFVYNHNGKPVMVEYNSGVYEWDVLEVTFDNGQVIQASPEHMWVLDGDLVATGELKVGDRLCRTSVRSSYLYTERPIFEKDFVQFFTITSIKQGGRVMGNCIQVQGGQYLASKCLIPTHNSELTSRRLPAYLLGKNPNTRIIGASYSASLSKSFNNDVQLIIEDPLYGEVFPNTKLGDKSAESKDQKKAIKNAAWFQVAGNKGYYRSVGVAGSLTGISCDVGIIDDPVKDDIEAESPTYRERTWNWFTKVFLTRQHNMSQTLVTQTRWNEDDLSGRILDRMNEEKDWVVLSLPAIKEGDTHPRDPRKNGEVLWPEMHDKKKIYGFKKADPRGFQALYQQNPQPFKGGLVYPEWYSITPSEYEKINVEPVYGLDFGYTNPCALVEVKIVGMDIYVHEIFYKSKLTNPLIVEQLQQNQINPYDVIIADSSEPKTIDEIYIDDYNVHPVKKFQGSIKFGIKKVNKYRIHITTTSRNVIKEIKRYRWKFDKEGKPMEDPLKKDDHAMDAIRYAVMGTDNIMGGIIELPIGTG